MKKHRAFIYFLVSINFLALIACGQTPKTTYPSPEGYNLNEPQKFVMPDALQEISGIAFYQGSADVLYAEQDEEGSLYYLAPGDKKAQKVKFGKKGDYEDLAICGTQVVMLRSDGILFTFPFLKSYEKEIKGAREWKGLLPKGEYESMGVGPDDKLYVLCKDAKEDHRKKASSGYILQVGTDGSIQYEGTFAIPYSQITKFEKLKHNYFYPSAMGWNPLRKEWYIVASINKLLVVTDAQWQVKAAYPLNPSFFNQPEGLAFDRYQNLYISNEGGTKSNPGTLLKFEHKP